jgi:hypothetical protein
MLVFTTLVVFRLFGISATHRYRQIDMPTETNEDKIPTFLYAGVYFPRGLWTFWDLCHTSVSSD